MMDKPTPDCTLSEMLADIGAGDNAVYDGPNAHTIAELIEESPFASGTIRERAAEKVKNGEWVRVRVQRSVSGTGKAHYPLAFVKIGVYNAWQESRGNTKKLGEYNNVE